MIRSIRTAFLAILILSFSTAASAQLFISVSFGPPALPVYVQPITPGPNFIWMPGYWSWSPGWGYYWVPGTWVAAPSPGLLWTPGYWFYDAGFYRWSPGYWGPVVGFYGGINYGFGYSGTGFFGGYWRDGNYYYNRTVTNVNVTTVRYVYSEPVQTVTTTKVAYNGGPGGITARPTAEQQAAEKQKRQGPTSDQVKHEQTASKERTLLAQENKGAPLIAATSKPANLRGEGVVKAERPGAPYKAPKDPTGGAGTGGAPARPEKGARPDSGREKAPDATAEPEPRTSPGKAEPRPEPKKAEPEPKKAEPRPEPRKPERTEPEARPEKARPEPQPSAEPRPQPRNTPDDLEPPEKGKPEPSPKREARPEPERRSAPDITPAPQPPGQPDQAKPDKGKARPEQEMRPDSTPSPDKQPPSSGKKPAPKKAPDKKPPEDEKPK